MITLLSDDFKPLVVTRSDLVIASIAWGFTLGFGFLTTCKVEEIVGDISNSDGRDCHQADDRGRPTVWIFSDSFAVYCHDMARDPRLPDILHHLLATFEWQYSTKV